MPELVNISDESRKRDASIAMLRRLVQKLNIGEVEITGELTTKHDVYDPFKGQDELSTLTVVFKIPKNFLTIQDLTP